LLELKEPFLLSELPTNGSSYQTFLSSKWPTKWLPQIFPSIINNRVFLNFLIFGFVLSPFRSHRYHPIELIKDQDFSSYSFSLGVLHLWLSYSPRQSH
jgi:hypothetical protein